MLCSTIEAFIVTFPAVSVIPDLSAVFKGLSTCKFCNKKKDDKAVNPAGKASSNPSFLTYVYAIPTTAQIEVKPKVVL